MLDTTTKKRIDDCRNILVGKLPDPKAQIEQITIGLIYKFMDDMDKESIELGGVAKFFSNGYEEYSWDSLFDSKVSAVEMLGLYSEAIVSMDKNPNIPGLFRDIFKNAFLPYRDPETLKLFLKTIGEFEYTHSEKLGDAFEYLLSVMGSQGDAGQFRTPRHIIDFLVEAVDPVKTDTILDPACGTAGFLISAFKYIKNKNNNDLTPDQRKKLIKNFAGYDISPDMVRLSLVNLYLHGFSDPHIVEYDTLTSEDRWDDNYDVVLANPPFMSPKGGIRPHKRFSVSSNRSEVLFVDYIAEHLNPGGRAGIIVPEGVIFQSGKAYKALRKMLVENYLYAVVSLPAGVFNPYSGVKTSILLMDKELAKKGSEILFVKIENDGFNLGAQRNAVKGGQLGDAVELVKQFKDGGFRESEIAHAVLKTKIAENGDYNLSGERYKIIIQSKQSDYSLKKIKDISDVRKGSSITKASVIEGSVPVIAGGQKPAYYHNENNREGETITVSSSGAYAGFINYFEQPIFASDCTTIQSDDNLIYTKYLFYILKNIQNAFYKLQKGGAQPHVYGKDFGEIQIPLPPLSVQKEIIDEMEGYQKIIDGAKMVVENYKPKIDIDPEWEMVELEKLLSNEKYSIKAGPFGSSLKKEFYVESGYKIYGQEQVISDDLTIGDYYIDEKKYQELKSCTIKSNDILISLVGTIGKVSIVPDKFEKGIINPRLIKISLDNNKMIPKFFKYYFQSESIISQVKQHAGGVTMSVLNGRIIKALIFSVPPIENQHEIVEKIEKEQELVDANKQLIEIFEQKIKDRIGRVWGE